MGTQRDVAMIVTSQMSRFATSVILLMLPMSMQNNSCPCAEGSDALVIPSCILKGHTGSVYSLAFTTNGNLLVSGSSDSTIRIWTLGSGDHQVLLAHKDPIYSVLISPKGDTCYSGSWDGTIRLWNTDTWKQKNVLTLSAKQAVSTLAISPDGKLLACALGRSAGVVQLWMLPELKKAELQRHSRMVTALAFSPDGKWLVSGGSDRKAFLWSVADHRPAAASSGHDHPWINTVAISSDNNIFVTGGEDGKVICWEIPSGKQVQSLPIMGSIKQVVFMRNGNLIVAHNEQSKGYISVWDTNNRKYRCQMQCQSISAIRCFAISPDETSIATGGEDCIIRVWNIQDIIPRK